MDPMTQKAIDAVRAVFSDSSVSQEETLDRLRAIEDEVATGIEALTQDLEHNNE